MLITKLFGLAQPFSGQDHGFRLVDWLFDEASFVEPIQHIPVEAFPCAVSLVQGQVEECQGDFNAYGGTLENARR